jgi:dTDP-4-amino-4,6-dideoxygalactose transaminase
MTLVQISRPFFSDAQQRAISDGIAEILRSGRLINGPYAQRLEQEFAAKTGVRHAIAVSSCTTALQICLAYFGERDAEILVPAASFTTDLSASRWNGQKPVLVDIDPETLSFDVADFERKLTSRTKGVIWVHLTGLIAANHRDILDRAKRHGLFVVEDCAHAQGAMIDGRNAGAMGDAGCFSFFPTKLMTCGVGGMITTDDGELDRFARELRFFGRSVEGGEVVREGNDWLLDEFRACIALAQLQDFTAMFERRQAIARRYERALSNQPGLRMPDVPRGAVHAYYQFPVLLDDRKAAAEVGKALADKHGIQAKRIYLPVHQEKIFREYDDGTLRRAEDTLHRSLCLPMHAALSDDAVDQVAAALIGELRSRQ